MNYDIRRGMLSDSLSREHMMLIVSALIRTPVKFSCFYTVKLDIFTLCINYKFRLC